MNAVEGQIDATEVEQPTTEAPETDQSEGGGGDGDEPPPAAAKAGDAEGGEALPAYEPNYKFSVHGEEKEFDDWAKALVKDEATEKQMRDVMERYYGIEHIKQDREQLRNDLKSKEEIEQKYTALQQNLNIVSQFANMDNFDAVFKALKVPEEKILRWAGNRLKYMESSPEEQAQYDRAMQAQTQNVLYGQQNQSLQGQLEQIAHERRLLELDTHLSRPEVASVAQQFDQRLGEAGAFRKAVQDRGYFHWVTDGKDVSVDQAVNEVIRLAGFQASQPVQPSGMQQTPPTPQVPQPTAPTKKPVIPNTGGSGLSAVKRGIRNLDDIRKLQAERGIN